MANQTISVPDIGGADQVDVIEILVKVGDKIQIDTPLVTLESDKASMEIPSPQAGTVSSIALKIGDKVSQGDIILFVEAKEEANPAAQPDDVPSVKHDISLTIQQPTEPVSAPQTQPLPSETKVSAGPGVRRLAHTLGVNLAVVQGSGRKQRITKTDVEAYVKQMLSQPIAQQGIGFALPRAKMIDFSKFGETETKPLSKIKRLTGINVHQAWITIPQVTQFDHADITDLEVFRKMESSRAEAEGYKLTIVAFVCKVVSHALLKFPQFNSSLDETGENLIYKKYYHIGFAAETPNGLVVPVIKDVNLKSILEIAREVGHLSSKSRDKGLSAAEMSGGCFTISSLGGIGGSAFTPIVNGPEVAILGLSRASMQPVYQNGQFTPRLMLPLSLSYDHRVIDGAEAARFTRYVSESLSDVRRILL